MLVDDLLRADDGVLVLGRRRREHLEPLGQPLAERGQLLLDVGRRRLRRGSVMNGEQRAGVLGDEVDLAALDGAEVHLAGADAELVADVEAGRLERLAVDLGEQLALGEVGRADGDLAGLAGRDAAGARRGAGSGAGAELSGAAGRRRAAGAVESTVVSDDGVGGAGGSEQRARGRGGDDAIGCAWAEPS